MSSRVTDIHHTRLVQVLAEAESLAGTANNIVAQTREVIDRGGQLHCQPQMVFIVGCIARLLKDLGVIEQLQSDGVTQKKTRHL